MTMTPKQMHAESELAKNGHSFAFESIDGDPMPLRQFEGRVLLVVNTASKCGFTKQYDGLQALHERYRDRGLVVLGVPSNDFGGQEPGSEEEIKEFCEVNFGITFPMTAKVSVKGDSAHPFYEWAAAQKEGGMIFSKPRWNFHKYLVAPDGSLAGSFGSQVKPDSNKLTAAIEALLPHEKETDHE